MVNYATFLNGVVTSNPYISPTVILAHPNTNSALILAEFNDFNYNPNWQGFIVADGRSSKQSLILSGSNEKPVRPFNIDCLINQVQLHAFEDLIFNQNVSKIPVTLQDRVKPIQYLGSTFQRSPDWLSGSPTTNELGHQVGYAAFNVWVDVDENYATQRASDLYQLIFTAEHVV